MPDIEVVGSGFIPGVPGVWANTTIPFIEKSAPSASNTNAPDLPPTSEQETQPSDTPAQEVQPITTPPSVSKSSASRT